MFSLETLLQRPPLSPIHPLAPPFPRAKILRCREVQELSQRCTGSKTGVEMWGLDQEMKLWSGTSPRPEDATARGQPRTQDHAVDLTPAQAAMGQRPPALGAEHRGRFPCPSRVILPDESPMPISILVLGRSGNRLDHKSVQHLVLYSSLINPWLPTPKHAKPAPTQLPG